MINDDVTPDQWKRGKDALEKILGYVDVEIIEALAAKIKSKKYRESYKFRAFINNLKKVNQNV